MLAMKVVAQAGHFTFFPINSSGTRSSRPHCGQWIVVGIEGSFLLVVGERGCVNALASGAVNAPVFDFRKYRGHN